jgi:subtilisin family serine protease
MTTDGLMKTWPRRKLRAGLLIMGVVALVASTATADVPARRVENLVAARSATVDIPITIPDSTDVVIRERPNVFALGSSQPAPPAWGLDRIDQADLPLNNSYGYDADGTGVTVYVVDTGIRRTHVEFGARVAAGYVVPATGESTTDDCRGHGTHVAGTIGGSDFGVAKNVTIVPVRVFDCDGASSSNMLIAGLQWIIDAHVSGPAVANLSLGASEYIKEIDTKVRALVADGVTVVVAAGNDASRLVPPSIPNGSAAQNPNSPSPSCVDEAIVVAASEIDDEEWPDSNYGSCVDIYAPGLQIRSAWPVDANDNPSDTSEATSTGTSMAAPHVAGAAALILQDQPTLSPADVKQVLLGAASANKISQRTRTAGHTLSPNLLLYTCSTSCPPSAPRNVGVSRNGSGSLNLSWTAPATNGGSDVTGYTATLTPGGQSCTTTALSCTISGLTDGTSYSVSLVATNAIGTSGASTPVSIAPGTAPATPGAPTAVAGDMSVTVSWNAPSNGGLAVTGYTVTSTPAGLSCNTTGATTCDVEGLANGTSYTFTVVASNAAGASAASPASVAVVPAATWTVSPTITRTAAGNKKVTVSWSAAQLSSGVPLRYVVKDATGQVVCTAGSDERSCAVTKLKNGTTVTYTVQAVSVANESPGAATPRTVVGGLVQKANALSRGKTYKLSSIATTRSKGRVTWSRVSGSCTISGLYIKAPATRGACKIRVSATKSAPYPAQKLVIELKIT